MSNIIYFKNDIDFNNFLNQNEQNLVIVHFGAEWAPQCKQINETFNEIKDQKSNISFVYIDAEKMPHLSLKYKVTGIPTILFFKRKEIVQIIKGGNPRDLLNAIKEIRVGASSPVLKESHEDQLKKLIHTNIIMLFINGTPEAPQCESSRLMVQLLTRCNVQYNSFDILTYNDKRDLKKYTMWPLYPELYINGKLIGGVNIVQEMIQNGELITIIKEAQAFKKQKIDDRLRSLVNKSPVVLFMKGSPDSPKCGFSRTTVDILRKAKINFSHFDILSDDEVRQGLKVFSNWPTYPQLYVKGELVGGFDIIKEMFESGDLVFTCNK